MFRRPRQSLRRNIGILGNFAFGYADVAEGIYFTLGIVAITAGPASTYAYLFATIAYVLTALCYAELSSTYRQAGGAFVFAKKAFGRNIAFFAAWALLLDYIVTTAISALASVGYMGYFLAPLNIPILTGLTTTAVIVALMALNILGLSESAKLSYFLVIFDLIGEATVLIVGFLFSYRPGLNTIQFGVAPTYPHFLYAVTIAMSGYLGIEVISQSAGETKHAAKNIPRAIFLISAAVVAATLSFSTLAMGIVPYSVFQQNPASVNDPVSFIASRLPYGWAFGALTALLGISVLLVASNAGIVGVSRISYAMSEEGSIPKIFGRLHKKYRTPFVSIILFASLAIILAFSGQLDIVAELYNFGALLAYVIVGLSLISLRNKDKNVMRPFTTPFSIKIRRRGKTTADDQEYYIIPLIGACCIAADLIIWLLVVFLHPLGRTVGTIWMGLGLLVFYAYSRSREKNGSASLEGFPAKT
ncbi:MAG: APC family permease [Nitrososphaerales archaeon]